MTDGLRCTRCDKRAEPAARRQKCHCGGQFMYPVKSGYADDPFVVSSWETIKRASEEHERRKRERDDRATQG